MRGIAVSPEREVVEARERELDLQINTILLEAEAKKRGVEIKKILQEEVIAKVKAPTVFAARPR